MLLAFLVFGETLRAAQLAGGALVLAAVLVAPRPAAAAAHPDHRHRWEDLHGNDH